MPKRLSARTWITSLNWTTTSLVLEDRGISWTAGVCGYRLSARGSFADLFILLEVLLLKPSMDHYARLLKHIKGSDLYEDSFQGLLHWYESSMPKLNIGTLGARYNVQAKDMQTGYCSKLFREACVFQYSSGMKPWSVHTRPSPRWETELHQG